MLGFHSHRIYQGGVKSYSSYQLPFRLLFFSLSQAFTLLQLFLSSTGTVPKWPTACLLPSHGLGAQSFLLLSSLFCAPY